MNKTIKTSGFTVLIIFVCTLYSIHIQAQNKVDSDTVKITGGDRNVMLNAASANAGPREVNIGLPASVGGTTVQVNDLPVVYFFWPEMPFRAWRVDAMTNGMKVLDLGQTAINIGDVGFSVGTYDNLGTNEFQGNGSIEANHFGSHKADINISGPISNGFKYSLGAYVNLDEGTYSGKANGIDRFFNDQTQMFKAALSKDYSWGGGTGSISAMYKYVNSKSMSTGQYAPFRYFSDGSVEELDGFSIGGDNYHVGQIIPMQDAFTGEVVNRDALNDYGSRSHTLDVIGKNKFNNGLNFNFIIRGHASRSGIFLPVMTGIGTLDDGSLYQGVMILGSRMTPIKSLTSLFEVGKKSGKHEWKVGFNQWFYDIDQFATETTMYNQTVEANPKLIGTFNTGAGFEYHDGTESKTAIFVTDKWDISDVFTLNLGARLEYLSLDGNYIDNTDRGNVNPDLGYIKTAKKTDIDESWFNKAFMASAVYKMTNTFGLLGEVTYNEQGGHLESYSAGNNPHLKKSKIPGAGIGVFYNSPTFANGTAISVVSKATYITRDEYRTTINFVHPTTAGLVSRTATSYDIETIGWTTDVVASNIFKGFNLHFLVTVQTPKYKNYSGSVDFGNGITETYDYNDNTVTEISKVLLEIDPSWTWKNLRVWGSARYFSKQYANMTNSLSFKGRWETFLGANYSLNKNVDLSATCINLLNERGAKGSISGTDLMTAEQAKEVVGENGAILSGTYIRPFTVEFAVKYRF